MAAEEAAPLGIVPRGPIEVPRGAPASWVATGGLQPLVDIFKQNASTAAFLPHWPKAAKAKKKFAQQHGNLIRNLEALQENMWFTKRQLGSAFEMTFDAKQPEWTPPLPDKFREGWAKSMVPRLQDMMT